MICGIGINDMPRGWRLENKWNNITYEKWSSMIKRVCNHKNYKNCTICKEWYYLSNFVKDIKNIDGYNDEKYLKGELELDKDIKSNGMNKCYCCNNCMFVTSLENNRQVRKTQNFDYLKGDNCRFKKENRFKENNPNYGKGKKVYQYDLDNIFIKEWDNAQRIMDELGIDKGSIGRCCNGKQNTAGGFIWKYYKEEDKNSNE